jgi:tetrahydromethanopterin S-methyltransferase subunit A
VGIAEKLGGFFSLLAGSQNATEWPFVNGRFKVVNAGAPVVVATGRSGMAEELAHLAPNGLCMTYPLSSNVDDVATLIDTLKSNRAIQSLIVTGDGAECAALYALCSGATDVDGDVAGIVTAARARVDTDVLATLCKRLQIVDLLGATEIDTIATAVSEMASAAKRPQTGFVAPKDGSADSVERVIAATNITHDPTPDKAGRFRIAVKDKSIIVEHFGQKDKLLRIVEGSGARDIYLTLIRNGWVSKLDHAAYLGAELIRAEQALRARQPYTQEDPPLTKDVKPDRDD